MVTKQQATVWVTSNKRCPLQGFKKKKETAPKYGHADVALRGSLFFRHRVCGPHSASTCPSPDVVMGTEQCSSDEHERSQKLLVAGHVGHGPAPGQDLWPGGHLCAGSPCKAVCPPKTDLQGPVLVWRWTAWLWGNHEPGQMNPAWRKDL